jgi:tetratricopeptide (TPR) repeat protein
MGNLLELLQTADSMHDATIVSETVKEIWKAHVDCELRMRLDNAVGHLLHGKTELALSSFYEIVGEDPNYAEAWNKASTCEFMTGNMDKSLAAARKTLDFIPVHFQALNGLGLVFHEKKDTPLAIKCFQKSISIDPWSPVSSRLAVCLNTIDSQNEHFTKDDEPAKP